MYLLIDTATRFASVGLWSPPDASLIRVIGWHSRHNHTAELMPAIEDVLRTAGAVPADIRGIGVTYGPGGFSALRAGLGAAKGLAFALGVPMVGASTLEATAYAYRDVGWPVCAVVEAGRDTVAWARFQQTPAGWRRRTRDGVTPIAQLLATRGRHTLFCGEGALAHAGRLREALGSRAHFALEAMPLARLQGLAALAVSRLEAGESDSVAGMQPRYLRPPGITKPAPPRPVRPGAVAGRRQTMTGTR